MTVPSNDGASAIPVEVSSTSPDAALIGTPVTRTSGCVPPDLAAVSVSQSRLARRATCELQDWWATAGAHGGWRPDASVERRLAWAMGRVGSLPMSLGNAVHAAHRAIVRAIRDGRRQPSWDDLWSLVRAELNKPAKNRDARRWLRDPRGTLWREVLTREWPDGRPPVDIAEETLARAAAMLRTLLRSAHLEHLRQHTGRGDILVVDALEARFIELPGVPGVSVKLWAAPDCAYISGSPIEPSHGGVPVPAGVPVICDIKSRVGPRIEQARAQIAFYAWVSRECLGVRSPTGLWLGRVVDLQAATEEESDLTWVMCDRDLDIAGAALERGVRDIVAHSDASGVLDRTLVTRSEGVHCNWCSYRWLCIDREYAPAPVAEILSGEGAT